MPEKATAGTIYAGAFHRTMDAKNRVTVPSGWLGSEESGEKFYLVPGAVALSVMPEFQLGQKEELLRAKITNERILQDALRLLYGNARGVEPDRQGRIVLPEDFCRKFELAGEVVCVGVKERFEIWNAARWSSVASDEDSETSEEARRALEALGL